MYVGFTTNGCLLDKNRSFGAVVPHERNTGGGGGGGRRHIATVVDVLDLEVASGFPNTRAEPLAQVAARLAGGRSLGLLEPADGLAGGAPRAGARAPAACTTTGRTPHLPRHLSPIGRRPTPVCRRDRLGYRLG